MGKSTPLLLLIMVIIAGLMLFSRLSSTGDTTEHVPTNTFETDVEWLALNTYYHRGEANTDEGRKAITAVVFNRLNDRKHHWGVRTIKGIITNGVERGKNCDFSWFCDGLEDEPDDPVRYARDLALAKKSLAAYRARTFKDPTSGATWLIYKGDPLPASWKKYKLKVVGTFGEYRFYKF